MHAQLQDSDKHVDVHTQTAFDQLIRSVPKDSHFVFGHKFGK